MVYKFVSQLLSSTMVAQKQLDNTNKWRWLCSNKTLFTDTGSRPDLEFGL